MSRLVRLWNVGKISYEHGLQLQRKLAKNHKYGHSIPADTLLILEHYPVYTIGLRTKDYTNDDERKLRNLGAEFYRTNRGGLITFHGPGQLVAYPILNLKNYRTSMRWYVSTIEKTIISMCEQLNIQAETSPYTGVWVKDKKICAIGIHGSKYITTHGLALNCDVDLKWFDHITPCGIVGKGVTSLSNELQKKIPISETLPCFLNSFSQFFNCTFCEFNESYSNYLINDDINYVASILFYS